MEYLINSFKHSKVHGWDIFWGVIIGIAVIDSVILLIYPSALIMNL